ncbi:hypothetical protein Tco_1185090 [Tanacetum coccineum]
MPERNSGDSWTIEGWFRSSVSSIGFGQTTTITRGDKRTDHDHNSLVKTPGRANRCMSLLSARGTMIAETTFYLALRRGPKETLDGKPPRRNRKLNQTKIITYDVPFAIAQAGSHANRLQTISAIRGTRCLNLHELEKGKTIVDTQPKREWSKGWRKKEWEWVHEKDPPYPLRTDIREERNFQVLHVRTGKEAFQMLVWRHQGIQRYEIDRPTSSRGDGPRGSIQKWHVIQRYEIDPPAPFYGDGPPIELPEVTCDTRSHRKNSEEAGMSKDRPGSESSAPSWRSKVGSSGLEDCLLILLRQDGADDSGPGLSFDIPASSEFFR